MGLLAGWLMVTVSRIRCRTGASGAVTPFGARRSSLAGEVLVKFSLFLHRACGIGAQPWGMKTSRTVAGLDGSVGTSQVAAGTASERTVDRRRRTVWTVLSGGLGGIVGLAPHVLHHIGPLVGTALVAGAGGTALFGVLGLAASLPMLIKLRRKFNNWWAPAIALCVFTAMFFFSSFVVGPLISAPDAPTAPGVSQVDHAAHHS